ncbi:M-phase inducer phosphatase-like [Haliotis rubra]|uniref:M-phase inducer phosphatase-like n=1 Tax=Haliotis rubra TaxID=36100 RepID=UPI001EE53359|nr:M-phase inducer phosphatase-like [Haliotis rubra]
MPQTSLGEEYQGTSHPLSDTDMESGSREGHVTPQRITSPGYCEVEEDFTDSGIDSPENTAMEPDTATKGDNSPQNIPRKFLFKPNAHESLCLESLKTAVERMESEEANLIGNGTRAHSLPTIKGRHKDLKSVSPLTVSQLLAGKYNDVISGYQIIDCRYPYEYEGGHIQGALNLHTEALITDVLTARRGSVSTERNILIFHCEFSSERGPKLLRHLRRLDRKLNIDCYPCLFYPEVYLLDGGYKAFFEEHRNHCEPQTYLPMVHESYSQQLRHFRTKSKSWTAGEKQSMRSRRLDGEIVALALHSLCPLQDARSGSEGWATGTPN